MRVNSDQQHRSNEFMDSPELTQARMFTTLQKQIADLTALTSLLVTLEKMRMSKEYGVPFQMIEAQLEPLLSSARKGAVEDVVRLQETLLAASRKPQ